YHSGSMDLRQLEVLRAIAESGSFTGAGRRLRVSQSAISRQVQLLEDEFGEPLFVRSGRQIQITPTGEALLQLSHRVFGDIRETASSIVRRQDALAGQLTLGGGMTVCMYVFPALVSEYRRAHPDVEIKVVTGGTPRLVRKLRAAAIDLALLTLPISDRSLRVDPVWREEMLLVLPPHHRLARERRAIDPAELANEPFITFESGSNTRRAIDEFFARERLQPPVVTETGNVEITKAMVAAGLGVSIVPYQSIAHEAQAGTLRYARVAGPPLVRTTGWVYLNSGRVPRMVDAMMDMLKTVAPRLRLTPKDLEI
ncbi:MAG TPA: LysR family transcriptional regulator, partial [Vicinamibacterales bacterium]|nr:LysR family transcriptional regulator [Vicinamibacterales bacterium]